MNQTITDQIDNEFAAYAERKKSADFSATPCMYLIIDTNQQPNLAVELEGMAQELRPLSLSASDGPYLIKVGPTEQAHNWLLTEKLGSRLGIIVFSTYTFDEVWKHARRFTKALKPDGEEVSFRYYDPFIFNQYASILSEKQRGVIFSKFDAVYAELGMHVMRTTTSDHGQTLAWKLFASEAIDGPMEGVATAPQIDLTGSKHSPLFAFSKQQYEFPVIFNMPLLIKDIDGYLREDFEPRMNCYAPGFLRAMIEVAMNVALNRYKLFDLEVLRQFAELQWRIAPGFYKQPEIDRLLSDISISPQKRWDMLLSDRFNESLVKAYDYDRTEDWGLPLPVPAGGRA